MSSKLLIFDLDGTLANTLHTIRDAVNMCMDHFGFPTLDMCRVKENVGNGVRVLIKKSVPQNIAENDGEIDRVLEYFKGCYLKTHDNIDGCYEGLLEVVYTLYDRGYKLAVLSNKPDALVKGIVKKLVREGTFSVAMGQTDLPRKPYPDVPLMIANDLGCLVEDAYFIGDSEVDIKTAKNAGMHSVAVSWGFRDRCILENENPDTVIDIPEQLLELFK